LSKYFTFEISVSVLLSPCSLSVPAQVILGESVSRAALAHVVQGLAGASAALQQEGAADLRMLNYWPARPVLLVQEQCYFLKKKKKSNDISCDPHPKKKNPRSFPCVRVGHHQLPKYHY